MADDEKVTPEEIKGLIDGLRKRVDEFGADSAQVKEFEVRFEKRFDKFEDQNQETVKALATEAKAREELKGQIEELELMISKQSELKPGSDDYKKSEHYKALQDFVQHGERMDSESKELLDGEMKTLRTDIDTQGGYRVTTELDSVIIKAITEISPVRSVARVKTVTKKTLDMVTRTSIPEAFYEGEAQAGGDSEPGYGAESMTANRLTTTVAFTLDQLGDDSFDLESDIRSDVAEAFAFKEGNRFVLGTGSKQPEGFLANATVIANAFTTAASGVLSADDLIDTTGELKTGYAPMWGFNRKTLAYIRKLKDGAGQYVWQMGAQQIAGGNHATLLGAPYIELPDMPNVAAGTLPVVYADFARGYTITDRTGMMLIRDEVSQKRKAIIEITFHRWNDGQVTLAETFKAVKIKA